MMMAAARIVSMSKNPTSVWKLFRTVVVTNTTSATVDNLCIHGCRSRAQPSAFARTKRPVASGRSIVITSGRAIAPALTSARGSASGTTIGM